MDGGCGGKREKIEAEVHDVKFTKAKRKRKYMSEVQHGGRAGHIQKSPVCTLILFTLNYGKIINISGPTFTPY